MPTSSRYRPQIHDLKCLFGGSLSEPLDWGFPERSSILVSGAPGAGKTTFALAMARGILLQHLIEVPPHTAAAAAEDADVPWGTIAIFPAGRHAPTQSKGSTSPVKQDLRVYYVTNENDWERLREAYAASGWFTRDDHLFGTDRSSGRFTLVRQSIDTNRPPPTSEELINALTHELRQQHMHAGEARAIIIVDSLSSLLRDCRDKGEERRQSHELMHRLENAVGRENLALVFFLSEDESIAESPAVLIEEYVVHFVFRLRLRDTGMGRRLRTVEIVKSYGVHLHIGEHTWAIITAGQSVESVIALKELRIKLKKLATALEIPGQEPRQDPTNDDEFIRTGVRGLDEMLNFGKPPAVTTPEGTVKLNAEGLGRDYWIQRELGVADRSLASTTKGLRANSVTVLVGPAGMGKLPMCLQFLAEENAQKEEGKEDFTKCLFINFELPTERIQDQPLTSKMARMLHYCPSIFRRRGNLDINALMAEIRFAVMNHATRRVVIEGLSSMLAGRSPEESTHIIENLILTFRDLSDYLKKRADGRTKYPIALFLTFEPEANLHDPLASVPRLSAFADNVIVVRPVIVNDQWRQGLYISKSAGMDSDRTVREVRTDLDPGGKWAVSIEPGLESFTGLFSDIHIPERVKLVLHLFQENRAEKEYNKWLGDHLASNFSYEIKQFNFTRSAITPTLNEFGSPNSRISASNVKVFSLDEWEVRDGVKGLLHLKPFESSSPTDFLASEGDFWAWEIAKVKLSDWREPGQLPTLRAVPCYLDFGLFCINLDVARAVGVPTESDASSLLWEEIVNRVPRLWCKDDGRGWFQQPKPTSSDTIVDWMSRTIGNMTKVHGRTAIGFAFDLATPEVAAVTFLEFAWAFGAPEEVFLVGGVPDEEKLERKKAHVRKAMRFLMFLVSERLMPRQVAGEDSHHALFSRHFYSTFTDIAISRAPGDSLKNSEPDDRAPSAATGTELVALPLFPTGISNDCERDLSLGLDLLERVKRFLDTMSGTATVREGAIGVASGIVTRINNLRRRVEILHSRLSETNSIPKTSLIAELRTELNESNPAGITTELGGLVRLVLGGGVLNSSALAQPKPGNSREAEHLPHLPQAGALDYRDILEFYKRHCLRTALYLGQTFLAAKQAGAALAAGNSGFPASDNTLTATPTGYGCTGSWMVGVHAQTHSAGLSCQLIDEITSLESAHERAMRGAGLPARKDFYEFYGSQPVTNAPYLTWDELLRACGARSRQRHRAIDPEVTVKAFNEIIGRQLIVCLQFAELRRPNTSDSPDAREEKIDEMIAVSIEAVENIYKELRQVYDYRVAANASGNLD